MQKNFVIAKLPTAFCHASTVVETPGGDLLCAWFGGSHEGASDVAIWLGRRHKGVWSAPVQLAAGSEAHWNPVLFYAGEKLLLFYKIGQQISSWCTYLMTSSDDGVSWSKPRELVSGDDSGGRGPVRNKPVLLKSGRIIAGGSIEKGLWTAFADVSDDAGATWRNSDPIGVSGLSYGGERTASSDIAVSSQSFYGRGVIQPSLWQGADGAVHMLLRSSEGYIYRSDSMDNGGKWCDAYATDLPNNNSGLDLVRAGFDGCLYLVCNPVAGNWGERSPLTLFKSSDDGATWRRVLDLETGAGEYSYPAIIEGADGIIITYTWRRQNIVCCEIGSDELRSF